MFWHKGICCFKDKRISFVTHLDTLNCFKCHDDLMSMIVVASFILILSFNDLSDVTSASEQVDFEYVAWGGHAVDEKSSV